MIIVVFFMQRQRKWGNDRRDVSRGVGGFGFWVFLHRFSLRVSFGKGGLSLLRLCSIGLGFLLFLFEFALRFFSWLLWRFFKNLGTLRFSYQREQCRNWHPFRIWHQVQDIFQGRLALFFEDLSHFIHFSLSLSWDALRSWSSRPKTWSKCVCSNRVRLFLLLITFIAFVRFHVVCQICFFLQKWGYLYQNSRLQNIYLRTFWDHRSKVDQVIEQRQHLPLIDPFLFWIVQVFSSHSGKIVGNMVNSIWGRCRGCSLELSQDQGFWKLWREEYDRLISQKWELTFFTPR